MLLLYLWKKKVDSCTFISMTDNLRFDFDTFIYVHVALFYF